MLNRNEIRKQIDEINNELLVFIKKQETKEILRCLVGLSVLKSTLLETYEENKVTIRSKYGTLKIID